jgi:hypothetical protein
MRSLRLALSSLALIAAFTVPAQAAAPELPTQLPLTAAQLPVSIDTVGAPAGLVTDLNAMLLEAVFTAHQELTMVRAKFKVSSITRTEQTTYPHKTADGKVDYTQPVMKEMHTIKASPVYGNGDPNHENTKFWQASPSGSIELGTVNADAVKQFRLGGELYVDFTPAD